MFPSCQTGALLNSKRDFATDKAWNWLRAEGPILQYMIMEDRGDNVFEMINKDGWPPKIETNRPDGSYATNDLFLRHEKHHNWYKYVGRSDDTLVQILGEKTNPGIPNYLITYMSLTAWQSQSNLPFAATALMWLRSSCLVPVDLKSAALFCRRSSVKN